MNLPPFTTIAWYGNFVILFLIAVVGLIEYMKNDDKQLKTYKNELKNNPELLNRIPIRKG
jgi:hypothetical protein